MTSLAILVAAIVGTVLLLGAVVSPGEGHVPQAWATAPPHLEAAHRAN